MHLAIFDLDGTLTDTNEVDTECFVMAWKSEFGIDVSDVEWSAFEHVSDSGIAHSLCERHFSSAERRVAFDRVRARFLSLLAAAAAERPASFRAMAGALQLVEALSAHDWRVAVATGAWAESARIKLTAAGFKHEVPVSSSDCCTSREEIARHAMRMAETEYGCSFGRTVLVGDAPWDVSTAARLHIPFVGVGSSERAARLLRSGAQIVVPDFSCFTAVRDALTCSPEPAIPVAS